MTTTQDPVAAVLARALLPQRVRRSGIPVQELGLAAAVLALQTVLAVLLPASDGRTPDVAGWALLTASALVLIARRRAPWLTTVAMILLVGPYHSLDYVHTAALPAALIALYSLAVAGPPMRSFLTVAAALTTMSTVMLGLGKGHQLSDLLRGAGWLVVVVLIGEAVRIHRNYIAAIMERAERAERTREEEAARRVAEERLRIARDLHDLLAHSITLIGVQTSVAAHVLVADPERLDRGTIAGALDGIADTCRDARSELRTTLEVLRANDPNGYGPLPGLSGIPDLVRSAQSAGARVELEVRAGAEATDTAAAAGRYPGAGAELPRAVSVAVYRIVQEALTNAVRHAGPSVGVRVTIDRTEEGAALRVTVLDDGGAGVDSDGRPPPSAGANEPARSAGYGIIGMRERARSVGGTVEAAPRAGTLGFAVTAVLPLARDHDHEHEHAHDRKDATR